MLATRATEAAKRVPGHIIATLHRYLANRVGHVVHGDFEKPVCHLLRCALIPGGGRNLCSQAGKGPMHHSRIDWQVAIGTEHVREVVWNDLAQHDVAVRNRQRPTPAVARRSGVGAGRLRPDAIAAAVKTQDGPTSGRNRMDV